LFDEKLFLNGEEFDKNRKQVAFPNLVKKITIKEGKETVRRALNSVVSDIQKHIEGKYQNYQLSKGNILMSLPSDQSQIWHMDFDVEKVQLQHVPLVFFVAIDPCRLDFLMEPENIMEDIKAVTTKPLEKGHLLSFNGHAIHRGCRYNTTNFRIHFYAVHEDD